MSAGVDTEVWERLIERGRGIRDQLSELQKQAKAAEEGHAGRRWGGTDMIIADLLDAWMALDTSLSRMGDLIRESQEEQEEDEHD